jgi:hypothetical protein
MTGDGSPFDAGATDVAARYLWKLASIRIVDVC